MLDRSAQLVSVRGRTVQLTPQEMRLLTLMMQRADHIISSADILNLLWRPHFNGDIGIVAICLLRLRKKLEHHPGASRHLRTVRTVGYVFHTIPVLDPI